MIRFLSFLRQFPEYFFGTCFTLALLLAAGGHLFAASSYLVANEPQLFLDVNLSTTQTTGIVLAAPQLNGSNWLFSTTTGGVLRIRQGSKREDLYYATASANSTTFKVTLSGVIRNLCPQTFLAYTSCGAGQQFSKGAIVELNQDARLFNLKAAIDRVNTFTGSGQITGSSTNQATIDLNSVTTAQRDAFTFVNDGNVIYNSTVGMAQYRANNAWYSFGSGGALVTASETVAGKSELATVADQIAKTGNGDSGAPTVLQAKYATQSGSKLTNANNTYQAGRVPILNTSGALAASLGGIGRTNPSSGSLLVGAGSGSVNLISASANSGKVLKANGTAWVPLRPSLTVLDVQVAASANKGASSVAEQNLYQYAMSGANLAAGDVIKIELPCRVIQTSGSPIFRVRIGAASGTIMAGTATTFDLSGAEQGCNLTATITIRTTGAGGTAAGGLVFVSDPVAGTKGYGAAGSSSDISVNTTGSVRFTVTVQETASNANNYVNYQQAFLTRYTKQ